MKNIKIDYQLLKELCQLPALSGNEMEVKQYLLAYIKKNQDQWLVKPIIVEGDGLMDSFYLVFGNPKTAVFTHMDTVGFMVRYNNELIPMGGPVVEANIKLIGKDMFGKIETKTTVQNEDEKIPADFERIIQPGTQLTFDCNFRETDESIQSCYLDNRLGVWVALKLAETLENGILAFSCWEEHGGGSVSVLIKDLVEKYSISQSLICDITWVTEGVYHGKGVAISIRDRSIPRRSYVDKIISLAEKSGIDYQIEVEAYGGSDGKEIQASPYAVDWCFVGAPESNVHSPNELVFKKDIDCMLALYQYLMKNL
jgi:putative aminopeptidase FrvX